MQKILTKEKVKDGFDRKFNRRISDKIREHRESERYNAVTFAKIVNVKPNTYFYYEKGARTIPMSVIINYCNYFGKDYKEFIDETVREINN